MNLSESVGFFGEASSKIINTAMLGEIKLEIIFTSQIASCILGTSVPAATPVYAQAANVFEDQNNTTTNTYVVGDVVADATASAGRAFRRANIQKFTANFTTGDTGVPTAGNADVNFASAGAAGGIAADANQTYSIQGIYRFPFIYNMLIYFFLINLYIYSFWG